jgi:hypothetical protein
MPTLPRRFAQPWVVIEHDESYEVQDAAGLHMAFVHFDTESTRQSMMNRLSKDEAHRMATQIARLPELIRLAKGLDSDQAYSSSNTSRVRIQPYGTPGDARSLPGAAHAQARR